MENNKPKVLIAVPCRDVVHWKVALRIASILENKKYNEEFKIDTCYSAGFDIGENRNSIVRSFLQTDFDWLVMIDTDNPPPANLLELIKLDKDVLGLPTPINLNYGDVANLFWNVGDGTSWKKYAGKGLEQVHRVGTGCIIIRRNVLENIKYPFTTIRDENDKRVVGTDSAFCDKCREAGFEIWTHWDYPCSHYKEVNLLHFI